MGQSLASAHPPSLAGEGYPEAVHLGQVGRALKIRWRWIAGPALAALAASAIFVNVVTPRYTGEARLILENRDSFFTRPTQDRADLPLQIDEQAVASQVQVVMSRDLAREAIKQLGLVGNPEFDPLVGEVGPLKRLMIMLGISKNPLDRPPEDRVLENYYDRLLVYPVGKSRILAIEFRSKDPELAAQGANTIAEIYREMQEDAKKDTVRSASTWLGSNIEALRKRVSEAEAKVEAYRAKTGLFLGTNNGNVGAQHLSELNTQLAQARTAQADAEAKAKLIRDLIKAKQTFEIPDVANNELIRRLIEQRVGLRAQLALEERTLLPQHPRVKELTAQLNDLEAQIRGATERTVRTLENDARIAGSRVETLQATIDGQKKVVAQGNESEVQLRALEREAKAQREQLESYLTRYREATARDSENAVPADARIVSRAVVPVLPSFPKKLPIVVFATLATAILAAGAIVARELLADASAMERRSPIAYRGSDPSAEAADQGLDRPEPWPLPAVYRRPSVSALDDTALSSEKDLAADPDRFALETLVARLSTAEPQGRGRRVLITSIERSDEAGALAHALGRLLAQRGRAILVAADGGALAADRPGFTDLVAGEASFLDIIERDSKSRLHVIGAGLLDGALLAEEWQGVDIALSAFDETYDWVICLLHDSRDPLLLPLFAPRIDTVVIASDAEPADSNLVDLYDRAKKAGAHDVVVARETAAVAAELEAA
jgi:polysaccharide biosynthesis transport protein